VTEFICFFSSFIVRTATFFQGLPHTSIFRAIQRLAMKFFISSARYVILFVLSLVWSGLLFCRYAARKSAVLTKIIFPTIIASLSLSLSLSRSRNMQN